MSNPRNIILVGFMGTGKSSIGRVLASRLGWSFRDTDDMIEELAGSSISEIFRQEGEASFRRIEAEVAESLAGLTHHVIATGGGILLAEQNRARLNAAGRLALLTATPETIWKRVRHETHRPLLAKPDPMAEIARLLAERKPIYDLIEIRIATDDRPIDSVAEELLDKLKLRPINDEK